MTLAAASAVTRNEQIDRFLSQVGWGGSVRTKLAGDASFRRYDRVRKGSDVAVLMDAPPDKEDTRSFIRVTEYLSVQGFSVPQLIAKDEENGFLLLEDLGDNLVSAVLAGKRPITATEIDIYRAATDVLVAFHHTRSTVPDTLKPYDTALLLTEASLFSDWFLPQIVGADTAKSMREEFLGIWKEIFEVAQLPCEYFVHRDYHADNLLWLPERGAIRNCGMLDYQDAVRGAAAYDMVSFLEDARRDVATETVHACISHYLAETGLDKDRFITHYAVLGAQRNTKIVGIFTRLAVRDNKQHYLALLPRVWGHLTQDIKHPLLATLQKWLNKYIPTEQRGILTLTINH